MPGSVTPLGMLAKFHCNAKVLTALSLKSLYKLMYNKVFQQVMSLLWTRFHVVRLHNGLTVGAKKRSQTIPTIPSQHYMVIHSVHYLCHLYFPSTMCNIDFINIYLFKFIRQRPSKLVDWSLMSYSCAASETISSETPAFLQAMFSSVREVSASRLRVRIVVT